MEVKSRFNATNNWVLAWKNKYAIRTQKKTSRDFIMHENDLKKLETLIENENLQLCQIFKVDEIIFEYKNISNDLRSTDSKHYQNYVSVMICTNADGTLKLPITIVGSTPEQKVLEKCSQPMYYVYQKSSWVTSEILIKWFTDDFASTVSSFLRKKSLPIKALLLLQDTPCHPAADRLVKDDIKTYNIPQFLTKPLMEFYITDFLKMYYKKFLVQSILTAQKKDIDLNNFLKKFTIQNAIDLLSNAWDAVSDMSIYKCWKNTLPNHFFETKVDLENDKCILNREIYNIMSQIKEFQNLDEEVIYNWIDESDKDMYPLPTSTELIEMICEKNFEEGK